MVHVKTGVFATNEEGEAIHRQARIVSMTIHVLARKHALPEIEGYYGIDMKTGEFLRDPQPGEPVEVV
jgi:hypothetical protein